LICVKTANFVVAAMGRASPSFLVTSIAGGIALHAPAAATRLAFLAITPARLAIGIARFASILATVTPALPGLLTTFFARSTYNAGPVAALLVRLAGAFTGDAVSATRLASIFLAVTLIAALPFDAIEARSAISAFTAATDFADHAVAAARFAIGIARFASILATVTPALSRALVTFFARSTLNAGPVAAGLGLLARTFTGDAVSATNLALTFAAVTLAAALSVDAISARTAIGALAATTNIVPTATALARLAVCITRFALLLAAIDLALSGGSLALLAWSTFGDTNITAANLPLGTGGDAYPACRIAFLTRRTVDAGRTTACIARWAVIDTRSIAADLTICALFDADTAAALLAFGTHGLANTADWIESFTLRAIDTLTAAANSLLASIDASAVAAFLAVKVADVRAIAVPALLTFGAFPLNAAFCPADRARVFTLILTADVGARLTGTVAGAANAHLASVAVIGTVCVETCAVG
jgi:hypothetical protein